MRLLSPKKALEAVKGEEEARIRERADYETITSKLRVDYFNFKRDTESLMNEITLHADEEKTRIQQEIDTINNELIRLKSDKEKALEPIDALRETIESLFSQASIDRNEAQDLLEKAKIDSTALRTESEEAKKKNEEAKTALRDAAQARKKAQEVLIETWNQEKEILEKLEKRSEGIREKELTLEDRQRNIEVLELESRNAKEVYLEKIKDLTTREWKLESRQQALSAAIKQAKELWPMSMKIMDM